MKNLKPKIPIIILNWNGLEDTIECMKSLSYLRGENYQILLVDNGSDNNEAEALTERYGHLDNVTLICNEENEGFTRGNSNIVNTILNNEIVPEFIVLLNNDTVVTPDWFENLVGSAVDNNSDVVSSKMINYYDRSKIDNVGHFMLNTGEILPRGHGEPIEDYCESFDNVGACGGAALYRTSMIQEIGFFDLHFDTGYEDAEFGLRAKLLGYKCRYEASAIIYHKVSRSIKKIMDESFLQRIQINIFYTYIKLMPKRFLLINGPFAISKYLLLLLVGIITFKIPLLWTHIKTIYKFFSKDIWSAIALRRVFHKENHGKLLYQKNFLRPAQFFVVNDFKRLLMRNKMLY